MARKALKKARKPVDVCAVGPTRERLQHGRVRPVETMRAGIYASQVDDTCVLDMMREKLSQRHYDAGMRMRELFFAAGLNPRTTSSYRGGSTLTSDLSDHMPEAEAWNRAEYNSIFRSLGPYAVTMQKVCCYDETGGIDEETVREGLRQLAVHFGC